MAGPFPRVALVWAAMLGIWPAIHALRGAVHGPGYSLAGHAQSALLATLLTLPMLAAARRLLDGGPPARTGPPAAAARAFAVGALAFLLPSALAFAILLGAGLAVVTPAAPVGEILGFLPLLVLLVILYEALPEELAFRGYIYSTLAERLPRGVAVAGQAVLFALWGAVLWTVATGAPAPDRLVMFLAVGAVLGVVRVMAGSVWAAIGLHTAFQTVAQLLLNAERGHVVIEGAGAIQLVALGIVPFSCAAIIVARFYPRPVEWRAPEGR